MKTTYRERVARRRRLRYRVHVHLTSLPVANDRLFISWMFSHRERRGFFVALGASIDESAP